MPDQRADRRAGGAVPELDRSVQPGRGEEPAIGAEGDAVDEALMAAERADPLRRPASTHVPDLDEPRGGQGNLSAVGTERHAPDAAVLAGNRVTHRLAGRRVPQPGVPVV